MGQDTDFSSLLVCLLTQLHLSLFTDVAQRTRILLLYYYGFVKKEGIGMVILQIEHPVPNFDAWKKAFDSDPVNRKQSGVRRYRVLRPVDNPNYAIIDLEFDSVDKAEGLLAAMREVWRSVQGTIIESPRVRIVSAVESKEL
ncbi:MAG TPA: hypothetical protein VJO32_01905 [Ktedonobacteraceae bacterium]|nr:hypothetical protein [Ktedonobacteraceae bacterium]